MALVSIIVPVYNTEQYLDKCVKSLIHQTMQNVEIILVDDGSSDNCPKMCDAWAKKDKRIKVIHKENGGLSSARNAAMDICSGDYIGFVDSDDYVEYTMFEKLYQSAKNTSCEVAMCAHYTVNEKDVTAHLLPFEKDIYEKEEIADNFILPLIGRDDSKKIPSLEGFAWRQLFKRQTIESIHFQSERKYFAEDVVFDFEVYPLCSRISVVNEPLYYYLYNEQSLSNKYRNNIWEKLTALLQIKKQIIEKYDAFDSAGERLINETIKYIRFSVLNLGKAECPLTKKEKKQQLKAIREDEITAMVFSSDVIKKQKIKTRIILLLLKYRMYMLLLLI